MIKQRIDSQEVQNVRAAVWDGFAQLAKRLPDHHVLGVNLVRTREDQTAAVFTVVRGGQPVQCVVLGDARGKLLAQQSAPKLHAAAAAAPFDGDASPDGMALGEPPVKQPVTPGLVSLGGMLLAATFDVGEQLDADGKL
ncbi:MAG TPA: hypothetical protein VFP84_37750 [Kofleriaceae bacterium]|nr:hypothetical protein [Kofleriaceae bacterium]